MADISHLLKDMDPMSNKMDNINLYDSQKRQVNNKLFLAENIFKELRDDSWTYLGKIFESINKVKQQKI